MFSSGLSLRNNIKVLDVGLSEYKASNDGRVDVLDTFKAGLEGTGEGSIADLQAKHESQATLITTLESNASTLQARIDTFNAGLEDGADGTLSTIEQIQANKVGLAQELVDRGTEITRVEGLVSTETSDRTTADEALGGRIDQEITNRQTAITGEATARATAISKLGFTTVGEAEGILTPGSFPFSFGMGQQSDTDYGLFIPFNYTLLQVSFLCKSLDSAPFVNLKITHYPFDGSTPIELLSDRVPQRYLTTINTSVSKPGCLVAEVVSVEALTDDNAKFRLMFVYASNDPLTTPFT